MKCTRLSRASLRSAPDSPLTCSPHFFALSHTRTCCTLLKVAVHVCTASCLLFSLVTDSAFPQKLLSVVHLGMGCEGSPLMGCENRTLGVLVWRMSGRSMDEGLEARTSIDIRGKGIWQALLVIVMRLTCPSCLTVLGQSLLSEMCTNNRHSCSCSKYNSRRCLVHTGCPSLFLYFLTEARILHHQESWLFTLYGL